MAERNRFKIPFFILAFAFAIELGFYFGLGVSKLQRKKAVIIYKERIVPSSPAKPKQMILITC